jgi:hypothetical protein
MNAKYRGILTKSPSEGYAGTINSKIMRKLPNLRNVTTSSLYTEAVTIQTNCLDIQ